MQGQRTSRSNRLNGTQRGDVMMKGHRKQEMEDLTKIYNFLDDRKEPSQSIN